MTDRASLALELLTRFADRTGVTSDAPQRRYLWTDAFAVCAFLGLGRESLALRLVDLVHTTLGRRSAGDDHPTLGGVRIGKPLAERRPDEPFDEALEWERDGQYFHYLTKWMYALDQVSRYTGDPRYNRWARELASVAHAAFAYAPARGPRRMYWKMSVDLSRPQVASMGMHDPLDGLVTCLQLMAAAGHAEGPDLAPAIADYAAMVDPVGLATADPLGLGGLLSDAWRIEQIGRDVELSGGSAMIESLLTSASLGLHHYADGPDLRAPAEARLAFRELGLAIGLAAMGRLSSVRALEPVRRYLPLRERVESFWLDARNREARTWRDHQDINDVMLATALAPDGFLVLRPRTGRSAGTSP